MITFTIGNVPLNMGSQSFTSYTLDPNLPDMLDANILNIVLGVSHLDLDPVDTSGTAEWIFEHPLSAQRLHVFGDLHDDFSVLTVTGIRVLDPSDTVVQFDFTMPALDALPLVGLPPIDLVQELQAHFAGEPLTITDGAMGNTINGDSMGDSISGGLGNDRLGGLGGNDTLRGGGGNDILNGGIGSDKLIGDTGNDTMVWSSADTFNGGVGALDRLNVLGAGVTLDLRLVDNAKILNTEVINITGSGNNTLKLAAQDVLDLSSSTDTLRVDGNAGDTVRRGTLWVTGADEVIGANTYHKYTQGLATLLVDSDITSLVAYT